MPASVQPSTPLAQIYSDAAQTQAMANPTSTDGLGNYSFYAAPGKYEIEISGPGITTKQLPNVILPSDPASPTFSSISSTGGINAFSLTLTGNLTVNGSTSVVGSLASGTLTLSNQGSAPGPASSGTVNLYTKSADKRLYYKDETGTEVGPISSASGAQTNQPNTFTAPQSIDADFHTKGPNPWLDLTRFGGYLGPNYNAAATTCSLNSWLTRSSVNNMQTSSSGVQSEPFGQIEIQANTTNNRQCEGAFSLTAVPSATTFQFTRNEFTATGGTNPTCTGGTMRVAPKIILKWDSHYTYSVQSATCSGGIATVTVSPGVFGPANTSAPTSVAPAIVNAIFTRVSDIPYNR